MPDLRLFGATSNLVRFTLKNATTGQGKQGISSSTTGLIVSTIADNEATATVYTGSNLEAVTTLGTYAAPTAGKARIKKVDDTNQPGLVEIQLADARFAIASSRKLIISVNDAQSTILDADYEIELVQFNPFDVVRLGLTALPNVASGSAGALPTTGTGANQIRVDGSGDVYALDSLGSTLATASAVANIGVTSAALNQVAASATYTTGTDTGGVANTQNLDGVYDSVADTAGTVDYYYEFTLASTGQTGVGVNWVGYEVGVVNTVKVYAFNWGGASWDQIGSIIGIAGAINSTQDWELTSAHTGTGGNAGKVRIRFNATGLTSSSTKTDRILLGYVNVLTPPTNWSSMAITAGGIVQSDVQTIKTQTVTCGAGVTVGAFVGQGTAAISVNAAGATKIQSGMTTNTAFAGFTFQMTDSTTHAPKAGLTVTTQVSIDGAAFVASTNSATALSNGDYVINLAAADLNCTKCVMLRFTAATADDVNILLVPTP